MIAWLRDTEAHYDGTGVLQNVYSYISLGTAIARVNRTGNTAASLEYEFHGLASSTLAAVDASGTINASFSYAPFGELLETTDAGGSSAGVATHRRRMNEKYVDSLSDLAYYGARYYDKTLIGWTQADPLYLVTPDARGSVPRRGNEYAFSLNNPLRYMDPDGRDTKPASKSIPKGGMCHPSPTGEGCDADAGAAVYSGSAGTKSNNDREAARLLVHAIMDQGFSVSTVSADQAGSADVHDLTRQQARTLQSWLFKALTNSAELRGEVYDLLMAKSETVIALTSQGEDVTIPFGQGAANGTVVYFNPADTSPVYSGGLFQPGGHPGGESRLEDTPADASLAHELHHAYQWASGKWFDLYDTKAREIDADRFENVYRSDAHYKSRDAYESEPDRIPSY